MTRKNLLFAAGGALLFLAACQSPKDQIVRKWQVDNFEYPYRDSMMKINEHSLDTITVLDSSIAMAVGTFNVDSFKTIVKKRMSDQREEMIARSKKVTMTFTAKGEMIQEAEGRADTALYTLSEDGKKITLKPKSPIPGIPDQSQNWTVEKISSSQLNVKVDQEGHPIFIHLKPAEAKKAEEKK